ncbi:CHASE2 domain-containing protein [candidate division KSB3 bacterium]|uniref:CHASE2 domain-containing protein n=1 Tax=candidate division KSB3 bacterium TaxID=2044937 RepID=A0A9D5JW80_9BACT|nr:CHASE2 domain-containing protein [candidate division KSB3 bacterium]MBD3325265.1 CHASE2 domain-containing protein [candidate division KSB3 bacterium]
MAKRKHFGEFLVESGLITQDQLQQALTIQQQNQKLLGRILVEEGWATEQQISQAAEDLLDVRIAQQEQQETWRTKALKATSFWISLLLSLLVLTGYVLSQPEINVIKSTGLLEMIEAKTLDIRFLLRGKRQPQGDIAIVAVDEKADDELGRWQSSGRRWIAELVNILDRGGAKVIGFDLTLAEADTSAAVEAVEAIKRRYIERALPENAPDTGLLAYLDTVKAEHDYDRQLAQALRNAGNVILGVYHFSDPASAAYLTPEKHEAYHEIITRSKYTMIKFPPGITRQPLRISHSYGVEPNLPLFSEAAESFGHFNVVPSRDGYIRYAPLLLEYRGEYYPSLDLEIVRTYLDPPLPPIIQALGKEGGGSVDFIQIGRRKIPTDEQGRLLINYYGPGYTFPHYSISDVIFGRVPPETFQDKIVLLGFTSAIYQDLHSMSFQQANYPGVEVHATILENILREDFLTRPEWTTLLNALIILLLGLVLGVALHRMRPHFGAVTALGCFMIVVGIAYSAFLFQRIWLNITFPALFIVLDYLIITAYKYFTEERRKKEIRHVFQHYVSPSIVDVMLEQVDQLQLGGERRHLTALFSDIRGFTSISEKMIPEELVRFLNEYLSAMTKVVLEYEGTLDKYMGDAIMAFYGAPLRQEDHALRACRTAVDMIARLHELQIGWEHRGLPPMDIGIGINSGVMSVGNMGSEERFDYTIMGDNVNLASRLEGINKQYGTNIAISEFTYALIQDEPFIVRELDSVRVKGKEEPITIYELRGYGVCDEPTTRLLHVFSEGLAAYKSQQWEHAITAFKQVLQMQPDDAPAALYITRCEEYTRNPPPADWDGVFVMKTK